MYLARWMSWCALWRRTWKVWSPPEIHSYSSRWSTGMLCSACVTCNLRLDNISVSFEVLGSPGSSSQPLSGCWTLSQPRLCLRSSKAGWFLLHFFTLLEAQDLSSVFRPNLSRPEQERVIQISSHILSVRTKVIGLAPSTKYVHQGFCDTYGQWPSPPFWIFSEN